VFIFIIVEQGIIIDDYVLERLPYNNIVSQYCQIICIENFVFPERVIL